MTRLLLAMFVFVLATTDCATATSLVVEVWSEVACDKSAIVLVTVGGSLVELPMKAPASMSTRCMPGGMMAQMGTIVLVPRHSSDETIAFAAMTRGDNQSPEGCLQVPDGCIVAKREIAFVRHTEVHMRVDLRVACLGVHCDDVQTTCVVGLCLPAHVYECGKSCRESAVLPLRTGLVAYWKLDGDAKDASGSGIDLGPEPSDVDHVLQFLPGKIGQGLFPGMPPGDSVAKGATALQSPPVPLLDFANDFTVSLWVKRVANPDVDFLWWAYGILDNGQVCLSAQADGISPMPAYPLLVLRSGGNELVRVTDTAFDFRAAPNVWTHVIAFRRGSTVGLRVNGRETSGPFAGSVGAASKFYLARRTDGYTWQGVVDEVGKWNRALLPNEMDDLYAGGMGRTLP